MFFDIFKHEHVRLTVEAETDNIIIGLDVIDTSDDDRGHPSWHNFDPHFPYW